MNRSVVLIVAVVMGLSVSVARAADKSATTQPANTLNEACPGLVSGSLSYAKLQDLPAGVLLRAGDLVVRDKDLAAEIAGSDEALHEQLKKNAAYVLERMVEDRLVLAAAKAELAAAGKSAAGKKDEAIVRDYLAPVLAKVEATEAELQAFYAANKEFLGDSPLAKVRDDLKTYVLQAKQAKATEAHVRTLGQRMDIAVSAAWIKEQLPSARDNPIDQARLSGKPSFVSFGSPGCCGPDKMLPVLRMIQGDYEGRLNVVFVNVRQDATLAARYGIRDVPAQIVFDKGGKEGFRHDGLWTADEAEKKLTELGVK